MFVGALDQGTTSTRFMVFDAAGSEVARRQIEHTQILPSPGWVEHDPIEIAARVDEVIAGALRTAGLTGRARLDFESVSGDVIVRLPSGTSA